MTKEERAKLIKRVKNNDDVKALIKESIKLKNESKIAYISFVKELSKELKSMGVGC